MTEKIIDRAPEWLDVAGKLAGDVAPGAASGAQQLGGAIADGAGALGEAAGKGAADLGQLWSKESRGSVKPLTELTLTRLRIPFRLFSRLGSNGWTLHKKSVTTDE